MSGTIRQAIGLTKRRLTDNLNKYNRIKEDLEIDPESIEDTDLLYENFEQYNDIFAKISKYVQRLQSLDQQWSKLISELSEPNKQAEIEIRKHYIETYGDYNRILLECQDGTDHLRRRIGGFRQTVAKKLQLEDFDEPVSEGTLSAQTRK